MTEAVYLTSEAVADLATPADYVDAVREGYRQRGEGADARPRTRVTRSNTGPDGEGPGGMLTSYTAVLPDTGAMGGYTYSAGFGAGDAWFLTPLFDADSGEPLAVLDGAAMNPFKTGAAGAVGLDALAREDATDLAVIGSGTQARGQLLAAATVREWDRVEVYSPTKAHRETFAGRMNERLDPTVAAVASSAAAVEGADAVITATTASTPVFDGSLLAPGTHVTAVGQYDPEKNELDAETIRRATYVPDLRERVLRDAGSFLAAMAAGAVTEDDIGPELGAVVAGAAEGRERDEAITVFDSGGTAIETVAAAHLLYERAVERDRGTTIDVAPASEAMPGRED
jgi:alanine dehydrogenase